MWIKLSINSSQYDALYQKCDCSSLRYIVGGLDQHTLPYIFVM